MAPPFEASGDIEFVTSVSKAYFTRHGRKLVHSFLQYVHSDIRLRIYCEASHEKIAAEEYLDVKERGTRLYFIDLFEATGLGIFLEKAKRRVEARIGEVALHAEERLATPGYDYRWDATTFAKKAYAVAHALVHSRARYLFWVDADVVFFKQMTKEFLRNLLQTQDLVYFGRSHQHSETGFMGFDLRSKQLRELGRGIQQVYDSLEIFNLDGWTDCHVFDHVRSRMEKARELISVNLSSGRDGHVIAESVLSPYLDHMKGPRKLTGSSPERAAHLRRIST